jgi:hypothetical protein
LGDVALGLAGVGGGVHAELLAHDVTEALDLDPGRLDGLVVEADSVLAREVVEGGLGFDGVGGRGLEGGLQRG